MCRLYGKSAGLNAYFNFYYMIQREMGNATEKERERERMTEEKALTS